ncbi:hypothetical protein cand_004180 [Cryptosporidium andersoni]|uniref:Uncharacterized protein n=1 Tax=Cryptosporidium andersoni TaxID=117008 RepID=A0A1J4MLT4_9CRYT|nr:hypothetical protein cand_004180 [Cryptosporidium andersoni]
MQTFFPLFNRQRAPDPPIAYHIYPAQQSYPISNYPNNYHYHNPYYNIDESELHISDQHLSSDEYQNSTSEGPVCCPHEIQKSKVHKVSPNSRVRKQLFMADRNRLPKFRDPWRYLDQSTQSHTEQPLSRDEARRIREIWQDTRAQYDPSDHEIEEEYLYEEEYNDENAERRRIELVEKGAKLVRYSYHYQLPTISALIKSTNPEQFRSRALSPIVETHRSPKHNQQGDEISNEGFEEQKSDEPFIGRTYHRSTYPMMEHNNGTENSSVNYNWIYHNQESNEDHYQNQAPYDESLDYSKTNPNENLLSSSNEHDANNKLGIKDNYTPSHRHSTTGFEYETPPQSGHRRLTSPAALSTERSINRRPPPQISILEPIDTTEELVSPVTIQGRNYKTPRIEKVTSQDDSKLNYSGDESESGKEKPLLESPSGKQTIVFHMLPDTNVNSSSATILADPDTQNIVTEIHITPGVDINITSTPSGPSIEYEVSKEKTAKAQINFSSESATKLNPKRKENISNARNNVSNFSDDVSNSIEKINNKKNHFRKVDKGGINSVIDSEYTTQEFPHSYEPKINTDDYEVQLHSSNNLNNSSREKKKMAFQNQKHSNGYPNRLLNMLTCSNIETADLHTFRSLTPVEVKILKH